MPEFCCWLVMLKTCCACLLHRAIYRYCFRWSSSTLSSLHTRVILCRLLTPLVLSCCRAAQEYKAACRRDALSGFPTTEAKPHIYYLPHNIKRQAPPPRPAPTLPPLPPSALRGGLRLSFTARYGMKEIRLRFPRISWN